MARVDVVVPSYNYAAYLEGCVRSLLDQPGVDVRVLVIDDASTDGTPEVGRRLAAADSRLTYRRHAQNAGHIATYNEGLIDWADGDYVLLISADDLLAPGALARAVRLLELHPEATFASGRQLTFETTPPALGAGAASSSCDYRLQSGRAFIAAVAGTGENPVATPTVVVRTSAQHRVGGYERTLPHTADLEMWLRLASGGDVIEIDAVQAFKRHHGRNMQLAFLTNPQGDMAERREAFHFFFRNLGAPLADAESLRRSADKAIAAEVFWRAARVFDAGRVAAAEELLQLAASIDPSIRSSSSWRRMSIKRRLGYRVWSLLQSMTGRGERQVA